MKEPFNKVNVFLNKGPACAGVLKRASKQRINEEGSIFYKTRL